jgi:hypothetical protein
MCSTVLPMGDWRCWESTIFSKHVTSQTLWSSHVICKLFAPAICYTTHGTSSMKKTSCTEPQPVIEKLGTYYSCCSGLHIQLSYWLVEETVYLYFSLKKHTVWMMWRAKYRSKTDFNQWFIWFPLSGKERGGGDPVCLQSGDHASGISSCLTQFHKLLGFTSTTVYFMIKHKFIIEGLINVMKNRHVIWMSCALI